jgi:hypothetical protein
MRFVRSSVLTMSVVAALVLTSQVQAGPWTIYLPSPYLSAADSPLTGAGLDYFYLEDFEDGLLNTPGVTASTGYPTKPTYPAMYTDSVDADDGVIDGSGNGGNSWFTPNGPAGVTFTFDAGVLGAFPTVAGIVWTDGVEPVTLEVYDASGTLVLTTTGMGFADGNYMGGTAEDRFFGVMYGDGISKITLLNAQGGMEMDHLQYGGTVPVPVPGAVILAGIGAAVAGWLRRRNAL